MFSRILRALLSPRRNYIYLGSLHEATYDQMTEVGRAIVAEIRPFYERELELLREEGKDIPSGSVAKALEVFDKEIGIKFFLGFGKRGDSTISTFSRRSNVVKGYTGFTIDAKTHSEGGETTPSYKIIGTTEKAVRACIAAVAQDYMDVGTDDSEVAILDLGISAEINVSAASAEILISKVGGREIIRDLCVDGLKRPNLEKDGMNY